MMKQPTILLLSLAHAATVVLLAVATSAGTTALAFAPSYRMPSRPTVFSNHLSLQPSLSHRTSQQKLRRHVVCYSSSSSTAGGESDDLVAPPGTNSTSSSSSSSTDDILDTTPAKRSFVQSVREYFAPAKDGLTFRQRLAKMGLAAVLSYGWVSNMSYCVSVSLAWYIFSKQVRVEGGLLQENNFVCNSLSR